MPFIGKIGYIASSVHMVAKGTISAGWLCDRMDDDYAYAQVLFVTRTKVICRVLRPEEVEDNSDQDKAGEEEEKPEVDREIKPASGEMVAWVGQER